MSDPRTDQEPTMEEILSSIRRIISEDDKDGPKDAKAEEAPAARAAAPAARRPAPAPAAPAKAAPPPDDDDNAPLQFQAGREATEDDEPAIDASNVLDLTDMVDENGNVVKLRRDGQPVRPRPRPVQDLEPEPEPVRMAIPEPEPDPEPEPEPPAPLPEAEPEYDREPEPEPEPEPPAPIRQAAPRRAAAAPSNAPVNVDEQWSAADFEAEIEASSLHSQEREGRDALVDGIAADAAARAFANLHSRVTTVRGLPMGNADRTLEELVKELLKPMLKNWLDRNLPLVVERLVEKEIAKLSHRADDQ